MKNVLIVVSILSTVFFGAFAKNVTCGENEVLVDCPSRCPAENCPKNRLQDKIPCPTPKPCPPPQCKCRFNYRRADNGTCIPTRSCPPFECLPNEEYDACPALCPTDSCNDVQLHGICPFFILIVLPCNPTCTCQENYCRQKGTCFPYVIENNKTIIRRY